jgi:hypothetical protein
MKRCAEPELMLPASRDVCFRCLGEEEDSSAHSAGPGNELYFL